MFMRCVRGTAFANRRFLPVVARGVTRGFGNNTRSFLFSPPQVVDKPKLILIGGCTGTGKSTFGMGVALDQGVLKCISTDTVRAVMRSFIDDKISPALHRSSYTPAIDIVDDDPVRSWRETCTVLNASVVGLVDDAIHRGVSLVVEGVHVVPSTELIRRWEESGGVAVGCLLTIKDADAHKALLHRRGVSTGKGDAEEKKIKAFDRVRAIQDEMIRLAEESNWLLIEQKLEPDPLEMVASRLWGGGSITADFEMPGKEGNNESEHVGPHQDNEYDGPPPQDNADTPQDDEPRGADE